MSDDLDRVFDQALLVERELEAHQAATFEPTVTDAIETIHRDAMLSHMGEFDHLLGDMTTYCHHRQTLVAAQTQDMQALVTAMRDEFERHFWAVRSDVVSARAEETRHLSESRSILRRFGSAATALRSVANSYSCQYGHH